MVTDLTLPEVKSVYSALVIEDNEEISYLIRHLLEREGFAVHTVANGRDAAKFISESPPTDVIITDLMLPYVDGFELISQVRESSRWRSVPVIVLSGKVTERDIVRAFDLGANDYLAKPYKPMEFLARVKRLANAGRGDRILS
jgi:DNA-binding response OmpR family regulator